LKTLIVTGDAHKGMAHGISLLANALLEECDVAVLTPKGAIVDYLDPRVEVVISDQPTSMFSLKVLKFYQVVRLVKKVNPDVIHIQSAHPWPTLAMPFLRRYPIVVTIHDPEIDPGAKLRGVIQKSSDYLTRIADRIIVFGENLKKMLGERSVDEAKIRVIPHGDYAFFCQWQDDSIAREEAILFFGRIIGRKGLEYLLDAAPQIFKRFPRLKIIIAGEGDMEAYKDKLSPAENFEVFNDYIPDEQVAELFQRSKLVVLPYTQASQSGIVHIAFAFGVPVVATDLGSIPEVVRPGETGLLVPPRDAPAIAEAVIELLEDEDKRQTMSVEALRKMEQDCSWDDIARKTFDVYKEIMATV